jgi:hypothetical protein
MKIGEKLIPEKITKDLLRAWRMGSEGLTDAQGDQIFSPQQLGEGGAFDLNRGLHPVLVRGLGATPTKVSRYYDANDAVQSATRAVETKRNKLLAEYAQRRVEGKPITAELRAIQEFNRKHPHPALRIKVSSMTRAVQNRRRDRLGRSMSGVLTDKQSQVYADRGAFGEF